jgi:hypothetical protein
MTPRRFTTAQLAAAPSAWFADGAVRRVSVVEAPAMPRLRRDQEPEAPTSPARFYDVLCPVLARCEHQDVVVLPNGERIALRR